MDWCTIESDPGVFTELIEKWGFKGLEVEEIFTLDDDAHLASMKPIYGFVFLFKWISKPKKANALLDYDPSLYFANQVITNACATQALLSILLNNEGRIQIPADLDELRTFGLQLDPQSRGLTIGQCQAIKDSHNSFARPEPFIKTFSKHGTEKEDVYHFVAFVHKNNKVYELDGLQEGPILVGENIEFKDWTGSALQKIREKIMEYGESEIKFNLMVVKNSSSAVINKQLAHVDSQLAYLRDRYLAAGKSADDIPETLGVKTASTEDPIDLATIPVDEIPSAIVSVSRERQKLREEIAHTELIRKERHEENERRKHNYLPFIFELFKIAAENGQLDQIYQNAVK
jgi:ubiquitin carboxyl-terminal hydrolase L5